VVHRGVTNTCYNALDRHVDEGRGNQTAVIYDSLQPVTKKITDLLHEKGFFPILRPLNQMRE
jgi:acyl-coenzyme A synthetase/AMP-(fatty) acid ligase